MEDIDVSRGVLAVLVACIVRRYKRHNADSIDCVPRCQAMRRFQITETRKCKPGDFLTDVCHPGITGVDAVPQVPEQL